MFRFLTYIFYANCRGDEAVRGINSPDEFAPRKWYFLEYFGVRCFSLCPLRLLAFLELALFLNVSNWSTWGIICVLNLLQLNNLLVCYSHPFSSLIVFMQVGSEHFFQNEHQLFWRVFPGHKPCRTDFPQDGDLPSAQAAVWRSLDSWGSQDTGSQVGIQVVLHLTVIRLITSASVCFKMSPTSIWI